MYMYRKLHVKVNNTDLCKAVRHIYVQCSAKKFFH